MHNLLANAGKYSPSGTEIRLSAEQNQGGALLLSVQDQGMGIPAEDLPKLGSWHFRGQNGSKAQGAGIGLHLCYRIAGLHGGHIRIQSEVGSGCLVQVSLPGLFNDTSTEHYTHE